MKLLRVNETCQLCGRFSGDGKDPDELREQLISEGWRFPDGYAACKRCVAIVTRVRSYRGKRETMSRMLKHSFDVRWTFVVPPKNTARVLITQRQDGPFYGNIVGGECGHYYVTMEDLTDQWGHRKGSAMVASSWSQALALACGMWEHERKQCVDTEPTNALQRSPGPESDTEGR